MRQNPLCTELLLAAEPSLLEAADCEGYTTLHLAVISGNKCITDYLLGRGTDPKAVDGRHNTAARPPAGRTLHQGLIPDFTWH